MLLEQQKLTIMTKNALETKSLADVGADISLKESKRLVQNFRTAHPDATPGYFIGRNIMDQILSQPGCVGIRFRKCLSDNNEEHLVYTGVDAEGKDILQFSVVTNTGDLEKYDGIVADKVILDWDLINGPSQPNT